MTLQNERFKRMFQPIPNTSKPMTAQQISQASIQKGRTDIIRRFGSTIALKRFGISSAKHVDSPSERLDSIAEAAAERAMKKFMAPAKGSTPKPSAPTAKPTTSTTKAFAARGPNWSVKRFSASSFAGTKMAF
jgi:hypothetical protein